MLQIAMAKVRAAGWRIVNLDCVVLAEKPKLLPHRERIVRRIADLLELHTNQISLKGKTGERTEILDRDGLSKRFVCACSRGVDRGQSRFFCMRLVAAIILGGKRGSHRGALLSIQSLREKNRYRAFRTNLRSMTVRPSQVDGEIEFSQWEQTAFSDTLSQKLRIQFAMHAIKGVSHPMKRTWNANDGKSGIFSLTSTLTLGVMLSVVGCDQPQTVAQKDPSQAASVSGGTQKAGGTTGDSQSQPAKIDPEYLAPDGTVDLQGKSKPPKLHLPDVIDDDKHEIPADAVFGTPTLADPQPAQMENEGAKANAEPKTANEKATASPTKRRIAPVMRPRNPLLRQ